MTKAEQINHNIIAIGMFDNAMHEFDASGFDYKVHNLRSCTAMVIETENYFILRSYFTYIAAIEKKSNICVDVLRHEYGYTSTSAQHIAKFKYDFSDKNRVLTLYTWRHV